VLSGKGGEDGHLDLVADSRPGVALRSRLAHHGRHDEAVGHEGPCRLPVDHATELSVACEVSLRRENAGRKSSHAPQAHCVCSHSPDSPHRGPAGGAVGPVGSRAAQDTYSIPDGWGADLVIGVLNRIRAVGGDRQDEFESEVAYTVTTRVSGLGGADSSACRVAFKALPAAGASTAGQTSSGRGASCVGEGGGVAGGANVAAEKKQRVKVSCTPFPSTFLPPVKIPLLGLLSTSKGR